MSILDITNYVRNTPGNTNPAVIRSMVESEQRKAVYEQVNSLKQERAIGDYEWVEIATFTKGIRDGINYSASSFGAIPMIEPNTIYMVKIDGREEIVTSQKMPNEYEIEANGINATSFSCYSLDYGALTGLPTAASINFAEWIDVKYNQPFPKTTLYVRREKKIDPRYINETILIKENRKEIGNFDLHAYYDDLKIGSTVYFGQLLPGKKYEVVIGDKKFIEECKSIFTYLEESGSYVCYIGNPALIDTTAEDNGKDFVIGVMLAEASTVFVAATSLEADSISVFGFSENELNWDNFKGKIGNSFNGKKKVLSWNEIDFENEFNFDGITCYKWSNQLKAEDITLIGVRPDGAPFSFPDTPLIRQGDLGNGVLFKTLFGTLIESDRPYAIFIDKYAEIGGTLFEPGAYLFAEEDLVITEAFVDIEQVEKIEHKYLPEGVGYSEFGPIVGVKANGQLTGKEYYHTDIKEYYVKESEPRPLSEITSIAAINALGQKIVYNSLSITPYEWGGVTCQGVSSYEAHENPLVVLVEEEITVTDYMSSTSKILTPGLYTFVDEDDSYYISEIHYGEGQTIHPMPQEYVPALDSITINGTDGKQYLLTVSNGQLVITEKV